jgi:hypothetical protein
LGGTYYIAVYGEEYSEFSIYAAIGRKTEEGVSELSFITLAPGTPQTGTLKNQYDDAFYKVRLFYDEKLPVERRQNVSIKVHGLKGDFAVYASNTIEKRGAPNGVNAIWVGNEENHIHIRGNDSNYAKTIYVTVQALSPNASIEDWEGKSAYTASENFTYKFQISYKLSGDIQVIRRAVNIWVFCNKIRWPHLVSR